MENNFPVGKQYYHLKNEKNADFGTFFAICSDFEQSYNKKYMRYYNKTTYWKIASDKIFTAHVESKSCDY